MAKKVSYSASAGFMPFDLSQLAEIWTNIKDGNYFTAFRRAINLLDDILNPSVGVMAATPRTWGAAEGDYVEEICCKLEQWRDEASANPEGFVKPAKLGEPGVDAVPIGEIIMIINMVLQFVREWRKRRGTETAVANAHATAQRGTIPAAVEGVIKPEPARPTQPASTNPNDDTGETTGNPKEVEKLKHHEGEEHTDDKKPSPFDDVDDEPVAKGENLDKTDGNRIEEGEAPTPKHPPKKPGKR